MYRSTWTLIAVLAVVAPAQAAARPLQALAGAKLESAAGSLTITETRCPPGSTSCGKATLTERFEAATPRTRSVAGRPDFPAGLQIAGRGTGNCYQESAPEVVTGPDGSIQFIGSAARLIPGKFSTTTVAGSSTRRGVRIAWLEPLAPAIACDYFGEPDTTLALPSTRQLPRALTSPLIAPRVLKRSHFTVTIAGSHDWNEPATDGGTVSGRASWRLKLEYARAARGSFAGALRSGGH